MQLSETTIKKQDKWREKKLADELLEQAEESALNGKGTGTPSTLALFAIAKYLQIICSLQIDNIE